MKIIFFMILMHCSVIVADEFKIVCNEKFPLKVLTKKQLKNIYLKKITYIDGIKVFAINIAFNKSPRKSFEKQILSMSSKSLHEYWRKAHYQGIQPPKVLKSNENIISYVHKIEGAIAYVPQEYQVANIKIIKVTQ